MATRRMAEASAPHVAAAMREAWSRGNAVDVVVGGILIAAAESPTILLGPLQLLVGGAGAGLRAIDGRVRQPGLGVPRPRGLRHDESVPLQPRIGVPALPAAIALALAVLGSKTPLRIAGAAIERARARSAERGRILEAFARRGASMLLEDAVAGELTAAAGRAAGGLLTRKDLACVRPALVACDDPRLEPEGMLTVPWKGTDRQDASCTQVVVCLDESGLAAVACYEDPADGLPIPALGLVAPAFAAPVMRGQPRARPGEPRPAAAPIALRARGGVADVALGVAAVRGAEASLARVLRELERGAPMREAIAAARNGCTVAVARTKEGKKVSFR